jgi:hypothetical protein
MPIGPMPLATKRIAAGRHGRFGVGWLSDRVGGVCDILKQTDFGLFKTAGFAAVAAIPGGADLLLRQ